MEKNEIKCLVQQIRCMLLNKPRPSELRVHDPELTELQEALDYLVGCLEESNEFLNHLQRGVLDVQAPGRDNFLAGHLKELHSALRYLTWQANQVANGDYNQTVHFLGDFSVSFNRMIRQLAEREAQLEAKSIALEQTAHMMRSVMDSLREWIVVCDKETGNVIYANQSAKRYFHEEGGREAEDFLAYLGQYRSSKEGNNIWEYQNTASEITFRVNSYELLWEDASVYSHLIVDITAEKARQEKMRGLAYRDELTGLYNRRFCVDTLGQLLERDMSFSYCMIDLDGLKYANDHFGHEGGDEYLKTVAREIRNIIRTTDIACRIGGDEFAILLPNCDVQTAQDKLEKLDQTITALSGRFPMSISYGVSQAKAGESISVQEIIEQADGKMYVLKNVKKATRRKQDGGAAAFAWTNELATGDELIDAEHKKLIQTCNQLLQACAMEKGAEELETTLAFLTDYTKTHFAHEETLQMQSQYPGYEYHRRSHVMFMQLIQELSERLKKDGPTLQLTAEVNQRLCVWLINHIKTEDAKMAAHLLQQSVHDF